MTEPILSPAEEADAENLLAGLAEPAGQYAGLTPLEAAAAATSAHMSTCLRPSRLECVDCSEELHVIRRHLVAFRPGLEAEGMRWAADRIDPGPRDPARDTDADLVETADRGTATMLRHWAYLRDPSPRPAPVADSFGAVVHEQTGLKGTSKAGQERSEEIKHG